MIHTNKGRMTFEGTPIEILSEVSLIIHCLYEDIFVKQGGIPEDKAKEMILHAVETGFIPPEELRKQNVETVGDVLDDIIEKTIDLLETIRGGHKE